MGTTIASHQQPLDCSSTETTKDSSLATIAPDVIIMNFCVAKLLSFGTRRSRRRPAWESPFLDEVEGTEAEVIVIARPVATLTSDSSL